MTDKGQANETPILLSGKELETVKAYAEMHGLTIDEAASKLVSDAIARRIKRNTGKTPARVYPIRR